MIAPTAIVGDLAELAAAFRDAAEKRFTDIERDFITLEDVAAVLADLGVPDAQLAELLLGAMARAAHLKAQYLPGSVAEQYWFYHAGPRLGR